MIFDWTRYVRRNSQKRNIELSVPLSSCGTQTVESNSDRLMIENTIIIQADPMVQDSWDSARKITCDWQSKLEKMVTFSPIPVADLQGVAEIKFAGSGDNVKTRMEIQFGRGPFAPPLEGLTKIGDELSVVVYVQDGGAGYDILIKNCYAYDSNNFKRANKIRLLNDHGCLYRPHQMEYFKRTFDVRSTGADIIAYARMNAFKFPDKMDVYLSCELEMCKGGCDTHCEMDDYPIDIIETLPDEPQARNEVESVPITTFRPDSRVRQNVVKRRRKPKKFGQNRVDDDAASLLTPPATLSPEILELLEELGAEEKISARSFEGEEGVEAEPAVSPSTQHVTARLLMEPEHRATTEKLSKMSFSTLFGSSAGSAGSAGTHITTDHIPAQILNNPSKFQPSQLLSASIDRTMEPWGDQMSSLSRDSTGTRAQVQPRAAQAEALQALQDPTPLNAKLTNMLVQDISSPVFERSDNNHFNSFSAASQQLPADQIIKNYNSKNKINTLQQHLVSEGQSAFCSPGSLDPKCNPKSYQINVGGFLPISTTPNSNAIVSSTVVFTSPRSVEKLHQHLLSGNINQPQEILLKILEKPQHPKLPPKLQNILRDGRKKFGSRLAKSTNRFASFFGARKRRDVEFADGIDPNIRNVFAESETVNMIKGFQVVSAADLAFNPDSLTHLMDTPENSRTLQEEICFNETSFYAGLLVACSLLIISGLVSICSIRKIRKYQRANGVKKMFFGDNSSTLERYH